MPRSIDPALELAIQNAAAEPLSLLIIARTPLLNAASRSLALDSQGQVLPFFTATLPPREARRLLRDRSILYAVQDLPLDLLHRPISLPRTLNHGVAARYNIGRLADLHGDGIHIVLSDTGASSHPLIPEENLLLKDLTGEACPADPIGHGTFILGQWRERGLGLVPGATVHSLRIFDSQARTSWSRIAASIDYTLALRASGTRVVRSDSWGGPAPEPILQVLFEHMIQADVLCVASIGNEGRGGSGTAGYPGAFEDVIGVGSCTHDGLLSSFSSRGWPGRIPVKPDLVCTGEGLVSLASPDGQMGVPVDDLHCSASGTSFSGPIVAALAVKILQAFPKASSRDICQHLFETCRPIGSGS